MNCDIFIQDLKMLQLHKHVLTDCLDPPLNVGVAVKYISTTHGSNATYVCDHGYVAVDGNESILCDAGIWNGNPLICSISGNVFQDNLLSFEVRF